MGEASSKSKPVRCAHYVLLFLKEVGGIGSAPQFPRSIPEPSLDGGGFIQIKARSLCSLCFVAFEGVGGIGSAPQFPHSIPEPSLFGGGFKQIKARSLCSLCFFVFEEFAQTSLAKLQKQQNLAIARL